MGQAFRHGDEPSTLLTLECFLVNRLHHLRAKTCTIAENHVRIMPVNFHDVTQHHFEAGRHSYGPAKDLLVIGSIYLGQVRVVNSLEVD